jgi:signal peptidase I
VVALRCPPLRDKLCLKRVVGIPGDRIEFRAGRFVLNGQEAQHRPIGTFETEIFSQGSWPIWAEVAPTASATALVVPPGAVFVLNDKRSDREDSRSWGAIPQDLIEGVVMRVWMSLDWFESDGRVRSWPRVRWARLLHKVE